MSSRIPHRTWTTRDSIFEHTFTIGISGSVATPTLSASLLAATERHATVSGTSPGVVTLSLPPPYGYPELIGWTAQIHAGSTSSFDFGGRNQLTKDRYSIQPLAFINNTGQQLASQGTIGQYANPNTQTNVNAIDYGGDAVFRMEISKLVQASGTFAGVAPVSATLVDPIDASVASGWPTARVIVRATFLNRSR